MSPHGHLVFDGIFFLGFSIWKRILLQNPSPCPFAVLLERKKGHFNLQPEVSFKQQAGDTEIYTHLDLRKMPIQKL